MSKALPNAQVAGRKGDVSPPTDQVPRRGLPAWGLSLILHVAVLICLGLLLRQTPKGLGDEAPRAGAIALVQTDGQKTEYYTEATQDADQSSTSESSSASDSERWLPDQQELPTDVEGALPSTDIASALGSDLANALPSVDGMLDVPKATAVQVGQPVTTELFGIQGTGTRFVYVFDRSTSMGGYRGRPLAAAKSQLSASLQALQETHEFQIIFYNERPAVFNPTAGNKPTLLFATKENQQSASRFIGSIEASGATRHMSALQLALQMAPDVIFFLTDAQEPRLTSDELKTISRWNRAGATIHTVEFGSGPQRGGDNFLMRLARQNRGQHAYQDVTRLPSPTARKEPPLP